MERAIAETTLISGPQVADPTRYLVKQNIILRSAAKSPKAFRFGAASGFCVLRLISVSTSIYQWWKRRMPVIAIAIPSSLQQSMTASSLTEPPG